MLRIAQVAERLNHHASTVRKLIDDGTLGHHRCPGIRVSEEQLEAYLEKTRRESESPRRKTPDSRPRLRFKR
ncbi:MAG: hypothetical protein JWP89_2666 [Schlesneria sp.]|nr:hypothetical protein [Schlesneria sp.]